MPFMSDRRSDLVFQSPLVRAFDVTCHAPQSGCDDEEWCSVTQIVVPRRGVFLLHHRGVPIVADPNTALVYSMGETYQISHPVDGGDQCTVLVFRPELVDEALGNVETRYRIIHPATQLRVHRLTHAMATGAADRLESEESAVLVLNALAEDFGSSSPLSRRRVSEFQQRRVEEVRALLASQPTDPWHLDSIARTVYCSPFHLARQFRAVTGESIARYLLRLRLALALDRLAQGETNLARLAVELGFTHHSHFSAHFRLVFGATPTTVRNRLTHQRFQQMSKILTAKSRTRR
jgi:AraC family transcriptional regulator